ncbi:hypothetical protein POSPLADRAFT_1128480, partial [Postia placenta MAD-698-R-SB12]
NSSRYCRYTFIETGARAGEKQVIKKAWSEKKRKVGSEMEENQDVRSTTEGPEVAYSPNSIPSLLAIPVSPSPLRCRSPSRSKKASTSPSPAEGLTMSAANSMLESHRCGTVMPSSRMQMRKRETKMLDILQDARFGSVSKFLTP